MPVFFYVSAIAAGCAMIIFESFLSSRAFKRGLEINLLTEIARVCVVMLAVYATMKFVDLADRKMLPLLFVSRFETYMYWLEVFIGIIIPFGLLSQKKVRYNTNGLFIGATFVVAGFVMNRMNIAITGMEEWSGSSYFPSLTEFMVTLMIVTIGFIAFYFIAKYFPVFTHEEHHEEKEVAHAAIAWKRDIEAVSKMGGARN
jgi:Ni/Fe-hydrogenase subunit HybB-like protein